VVDGGGGAWKVYDVVCVCFFLLSLARGQVVTKALEGGEADPEELGACMEEIKSVLTTLPADVVDEEGSEEEDSEEEDDPFGDDDDAVEGGGAGAAAGGADEDDEGSVDDEGDERLA
jgi:hypothetical protein